MGDKRRTRRKRKRRKRKWFSETAREKEKERATWRRCPVATSSCRSALSNHGGFGLAC